LKIPAMFSCLCFIEYPVNSTVGMKYSGCWMSLYTSSAKYYDLLVSKITGKWLRYQLSVPFCILRMIVSK